MQILEAVASNSPNKLLRVVLAWLNVEPVFVTS